jgi:hypothetical protein
MPDEEIVEQPQEVEKPEEGPQPEVKEPEQSVPQLDLKTKQALAIYEALSDPHQSHTFIKKLAEFAGYQVVSPEAEKPTSKPVRHLIKERLGEDYEHLGEALEEVLDHALREKIAPIQTLVLEEKKRAYEAEVRAALSELKITPAIETRMYELMQQLQPSPNATVRSYIRSIYDLAAKEANEAEKLKTTVQKVQKNRAQVGAPSGVNADRVKQGSRLPTIREAVLMAARGEKFEE